jgi:hypothetical protein
LQFVIGCPYFRRNGKRPGLGNPPWYGS